MFDIKKNVRILILSLSVISFSSAYSAIWVPIQVGDITIFVPYEPAAGQPVAIQYEYDALGRLVKVKQDGVIKTDYDYDAAGNRTAVDEP